MRIDAVLGPAEIDLLPERDLTGTICVVFDVLRATSSMITALAGGVRAIYPVKTIEEALALKVKLPDALLGGERFGDRIEGFDLGNSPLEYQQLGSREVISTTTNGTVALRACERAKQVVAGALLNIQAVADYLQRIDAQEVLLVCAGTFREPALEDMIAAGFLTESMPKASLSDAAYVVRAVWREYSNNVFAGIAASRNGRVLIGKGREEEVRWCAQQSHFAILGIQREGVLVPFEVEPTA